MKINSKINLSSHKIKRGKEEHSGNPEPGDILISYYPQDSTVSEPVLTKIPVEGITPGPDNSRFDTLADVKPDEKGNFIFSPGSPDFLPAHTFAVTNKTINMIQKSLGRKIYWITGGKLKRDMAQYIKEGRIKFVDPSKAGKFKAEDFFDSKGEPYAGYTAYEGGKMKIVKVPVMV